MRSITIKIPDDKYDRLLREAKENGTTIEKEVKDEVVSMIDNLEDKDRKGCHGGWYRGHQPKDPDAEERTICIKCGFGLVKREINFRDSWVLDKSKKALHLKTGVRN